MLSRLLRKIGVFIISADDPYPVDTSRKIAEWHSSFVLVTPHAWPFLMLVSVDEEDRTKIYSARFYAPWHWEVLADSLL